MAKWIVSLTASLLLAGVAVMPASAKPARCVIKGEGEAYAGPCIATPTGGGSLNLRPVGRRQEFFAREKDVPGITDINLDIQGADADVRGLTTFGVNSLWGSVHRSTKDRACWLGDDFSICVY